MLHTLGLTIGYDGNPVVRDVTMAVAQGQIVTLVGPNGSGKSTLLATLAGQLRARAGSVILMGKELGSYEASELARVRSVLLTNRTNTELLTCRDVVELGRYPHTGRLGVLRASDRVAVEEAMRLMAVWDLRDRDYMQLSDGQRQRVLLARAICQEPHVLMLDEPTSYLDVRYQIELLRTLRRLVSERPMAIVMSLHELSLVRQVADWVVCLHDGAVMAQGTPADIFVPGVIDVLYDLEPGTFDARTGQIVLDGGLAASSVLSDRSEVQVRVSSQPVQAPSRNGLKLVHDARHGGRDMRRLEEYVSAGGKLLRCGYTTGTCAVAATRAAAELLLSGAAPSVVCVRTPAGIDAWVDVEQVERGHGWVSCAVRKDAGDDPDVTDGVLVWARVSFAEASGVMVDGGVGVGRVTKAGLDQPVGAAAINSTPRAMISQAVQDAAREQGYGGGLAVEISIPQGVELAERTFNPRLGIEGGISVLGTTGIVRPMSEEALISSIQLELRVLRESGADSVLVVPGNYGLAFARDELGLAVSSVVMCSNYIGEAIDEAARLGFSSLVLVGHLGKLVKVAGGIMNTHSRVADARLEVLSAHAALAGAGRDVVAELMDAPTTEAAVEVLQERDLLEETMLSIMDRMASCLAHRGGADLRVEAAVFSQRAGLLGTTPLFWELCPASGVPCQRE